MSATSSNTAAECLPIAPWHHLVESQGPWRWHGHKLVMDGYDPSFAPVVKRTPALAFVERVYATQNASRAAQDALHDVLSDLDGDPNAWGLNIGSGFTRYHNRMLNLDVRNIEGVDLVGSAERLPFADRSVRVVVAQEVLEHLAHPWVVIDEVARVLHPSGRFFVQVPFQIGYHEGPNDYWRFSRDALRSLLPEPRWRIERLEPTVGYGSGLYRIAVEYAAITASMLSSRLYRLTKGVAALAFTPLRWPDRYTNGLSEGHRIAGGFVCVARKERQTNDA